MINTKASAVSGPTPGWVCRRRASGHFSTSRSGHALGLVSAPEEKAYLDAMIADMKAHPEKYPVMRDEVFPIGGMGEIPLTNQAAGEIIGWGTGQGAAGVEATESLAQNLTKEGVEEMIKKGLNRATVVGLRSKYAIAAANAGKLAANSQQLPARLFLMDKILELWPK